MRIIQRGGRGDEFESWTMAGKDVEKWRGISHQSLKPWEFRGNKARKAEEWGFGGERWDIIAAWRELRNREIGWCGCPAFIHY